jgi:DNA repair exonuclease SbcCD ATPase subunit
MVEEENKVESKFKKTLLQTEKRIMDLEVSVSELAEKLKEIDPKEFSVVKERMEELEDLITVEQAGIIELKKMLEEFREKAGVELVREKIGEISATKSKVEEIEKKLEENIKKTLEDVELKLKDFSEAKSKLEDEISKISATEKRHSEFLKEDIENIKNRLKEISEIKNKLEGISEEVVNIKNGFGGTLTDLGKRTETIEKSLSNLAMKLNEVEIHTNRLFADFDTLKPFIEKIQNIEGIEKKVGELERASHNLEGKFKEIEGAPVEISKFNVKLSEFEGRLSGLDEKIKEAIAISSDAVKRVGSFEVDLKKIEKIDSRVNEIENFIQNLINVVAGKVEVLPKIKATQVSERISKIEENVKSKLSELEENYKKKLEEIASMVEKRIIQTRAPVGAVTAQIDELIDRVINLESKLAALEKIAREKRGPIVLE